jgi:multiple sugar transport system substrate-binding protein
MRARLRAALALVLTAVTALTACGGPEAACGANRSGPITFATVKALSAEQRAELTRRWRAVHPNEPLDIVVLPATSDEQRAQLAATLRIGERGGAGRRDGYDVVGLDVVFLAEFARSGFLQPLDRRRFSDAGFLAVPWETSSVDDRLYAVPFTTNVGLLYYWPDELARMGEIPDAGTRWEPADWQTVRKVARDSRLTNRPDAPVGYTGQLAQYEGLTANALEMIWAEHGDLPTPADEASPAELDGAARGVEFLLDGVRNRWIDGSALGFDEQDSLNAFAGRKALIMRHWPDAWFTLAGGDLPVGVTRLPGSRSAVLGGESLAVARCSPYRETAQQFIRFLTLGAQQQWIFKEGLYLPTVEGLYTDGSLSADGGPPPGFIRLLHDSVRDARARPADPDWNRTSRIVQTGIHRALERSATESVEAEDVVNDLAGHLR